MKPNKHESYESWVNRAKMFEHGVALQRIAQGHDHHMVIEEMSRRLMEKLVHPLILAIRESAVSSYDPIQSKKDYEDKFLKHNSPKADQVDGSPFDKLE